MNRSLNNVRLASTLSTLAVAGSLMYAMPAFAQDQKPAEAKTVPGEIVVTARKREESLLETPLTIVAITAEDIERKGVKSMQDLSASTPGININDSSSGHADRSFQQIIMRGIKPSTTLATTTSMFIDGVPVASPSALTTISAPERVEILKGPQSAFFGRNTFAGAINIVNKVPTGDWHATLTGGVGTRENYRGRVEVEGPIIGDALTFRATGEYFHKGGSWTNAAGGKLGEQSSTTGSLLIAAKPTDTLSIKLFGLLSKDDDGPSATTRLLGYDIYDASGNVYLKNQSNYTTATGASWFKGTLPTYANPIGANTEITSAVTDITQSTTNRVVGPDATIDHYGLLRYTEHAHATADWEISDQLSLSVLGGYNHERWTTLIDLDGFDTSGIAGAYYPKGYFDFPYFISRATKDWSAEGRLNYDFGKFHGVVGASYIRAQQRQGLGSGQYAGGSVSAGGPSISKTTGFYFGSTYDFTDAFSISVEGRYQIDKLEATAGSSGLTNDSNAFLPAGDYGPGETIATATYKNFTPRVIANWQISPDVMVYASYSKGVNPAAISTYVLSYSDAIQQAAVENGVTLGVKPEKLTNYEVGMKGHIGYNFSYSIAAYYAQWTNQITSVLLTIPDGTYDAAGNENVSYVSGYSNAGDVDLWGVEADFTWKLNDLITLDGAGAINATDIKSYANNALEGLVSDGTATYSFAGNEMANTSKYSANVGLQFAGDVKGQDDTTWYARADYNFKSGFWVSELNLAKTQDSHKVNLRAGLTIGNKTLSAYVTNVFNNKAYTSATPNYTIEGSYAYFGNYSAVLVGLPDLRTAGLEFKMEL